MKGAAWIAAVCALWLGAAGAACAIPNPFYNAYRGDIAVTDVSVAFADGILARTSDRAATNFVERSFSPELRAEFQSSLGENGLTENVYAERLSEFLITRNVKQSTAELTGSYRLRVEIAITEARIPALGLGAFTAARAFPYLTGVARIFDADSGVLLATAAIRGSHSWSAHSESAERTHGFRYNISGTDTHFRVLAGATEAMSANVLAVLRAAAFPTPIGRR